MQFLARFSGSVLFAVALVIPMPQAANAGIVVRGGGTLVEYVDGTSPNYWVDAAQAALSAVSVTF